MTICDRCRSNASVVRRRITIGPCNSGVADKSLEADLCGQCFNFLQTHELDRMWSGFLNPPKFASDKKQSEL